MRTFARDMSRRATIPVPNNRPEFAASEHFLYTAADDQLRTRTHDGTDRGRWLSSEKGGRASAALCLGHAPRELLFCVLIDDADVDAVDEIVALDARTLKIRYGFGRRLSGLSEWADPTECAHCLLTCAADPLPARAAHSCV